jgi:hypothetical protein
MPSYSIIYFIALTEYLQHKIIFTEKQICSCYYSEIYQKAENFSYPEHEHINAFGSEDFVLHVTVIGTHRSSSSSCSKLNEVS